MVTISHNNKWIRFHNSIFFVCSFQATHLSYLEQFLPCQFMNTDVVAALLYCITWNHFKKQSCVLFSTAFWVGARWFRGTLPFLRSFFWCCLAVHATVIVKANYQHRIVAAGCGDFVECDRPDLYAIQTSQIKQFNKQAAGKPNNKCLRFIKFVVNCALIALFAYRLLVILRLVVRFWYFSFRI